uniref:3-hydroxyisobutyryl-CoA hydrolase n=1 Tax=Blastobotrys adeninivorans TaxID=409370 RepID=A0A060T7M6_BLAAD
MWVECTRTANGLGKTVLNRPSKLNSLNHAMFEALYDNLPRMARDPMVKAMVISGSGKAFCAGGDIAEMVRNVKDNEYHALEYLRHFSMHEFALFHFTGTCPKPYVAIMDGIVMGAGIGVSAHAHFRVATERTLAAMPETRIGYFTDAGASFLLPRLDGMLGRFMATTSEGLKGYDCVHVGLCSHYMPSSRIGDLEQALEALPLGDKFDDNYKLIKDTLDKFSDPAPPQGYKFPYDMAVINKCFSADTMEQVIKRLDKTDGPFAKKTLQTLRERSPTAVKLTFELIRQGRNWSFRQAINKEMNLSEKLLPLPDLIEGIECRVVRKPPTDPHWKPSSIEQVSQSFVDKVFSELDDLQVPFTNDKDFFEYPSTRLSKSPFNTRL